MRLRSRRPSPARAVVLAAVAACSPAGDVSLGSARRPDGGNPPDGGSGITIDAPNPIGAIVDIDPRGGSIDGFGGPSDDDPTHAPAIVYPLDKAVVPPNLRGMTVQWRMPVAATRYFVRFRGTTLEGRYYANAAACDAGKCSVRPSDAFWGQLADSAAGGNIVVTVEAIAAPDGPRMLSHQTQLSVAAKPLPGGAYYVSTTTQGLVRQDVATPPVTVVQPSSPAAAGRCTGCHSVTADGCQVGLALEESPQIYLSSRFRTSDPSNANLRERTNSFQAWNHDGTRLAYILHGELNVAPFAGGKPAGTQIALARYAVSDDGTSRVVTHPAWTPDGTGIVLIRAPAGVEVGDNPLVYSGDVILVPYDPNAVDSAAHYGPARVLVSHDELNFHSYPTVSPDGQWVAFVTAHLPDRSYFRYLMPPPLSAYAQPSARLRLVSIDGRTVKDLAAAAPSGATASWPHFAPFLPSELGGLTYLTFASKLDYGVTLEQPSTAAEPRSGPGIFQVWVSALDLTATGDPSHPPFWLPQQAQEFKRAATDLANYHPVWTRELAPKNCP